MAEQLLAKRPHSAAFREAGMNRAHLQILLLIVSGSYCAYACGRLEGGQVRFVGGQVHGRPKFATRFSCRTWMFWCKEIVIGQVFVPHANVFVAKQEVVIAHVRVALPLLMKLCTQKSIFQRTTRKKSYPLRMITGPKECCTEIFSQICARTSEVFFNKQTHYSN